MRFAVLALAVLLSSPVAASDWGSSPYGAFGQAFGESQERDKLAQLVDLCERMCKANSPSCGKCLNTITLAEQRMRDRDEEKSTDLMRRRLDEVQRRIDANERETQRLKDCNDAARFGIRLISCY